MNIVVEKNIPIPKRPAPWLARKLQEWPLDILEVGDSFFIPDIASYKVTSVVAAAKKCTKFQYKTMTIDNGVRVWRTG